MEFLAHKHLLDKGEIGLITYNGSDASIAADARISYKKGTKQVSSDAQLIRYLVRHKHTSPLEQTFLKFYIKAPILVMRQWMRHRTWSYNEVSGRYSEIVDEAYLPLPEHVTTQDARNKQARTDTPVEDSHGVVESMTVEQDVVFDNYRKYLDAGVARETARNNLPLSTYTEVVACVDLHNLLHFMQLRCSAHAQYEIRVYADAIHEMVKGLFPAVVDAWEDCVRNAVTLTGPMLEALARYVEGVSQLGHAPDVACADAVKAQSWKSVSEKADFEKFLTQIGAKK